MSFSTEPGDPRGTQAASGVPPAGGDTAADPNRHDVQDRPPTDDRPLTQDPPPTQDPAATQNRAPTEPAKNMLPGRRRRALGLERLMMRLIATCGIVGIGVALGAILVSSSVQGWITGLVVSLVSVILAAILWSSRQL